MKSVVLLTRDSLLRMNKKNLIHNDNWFQKNRRNKQLLSFPQDNWKATV